MLLQASPAPLLAYTYTAFSARVPAPQPQNEPVPNQAAPEATPPPKSYLSLITNYPPTRPDLPQAQDTQAHESTAIPAQNQLTAAGDLLLAAGWNLVSLPKAPPDPATVLTAIAGRYTKVYAYDACATADPWQLYDPADPAVSDLTAIDHTIDFWIEMPAAATLAIAGTTPSSTILTLCPVRLVQRLVANFACMPTWMSLISSNIRLTVSPLVRCLQPPCVRQQRRALSL